MVKLTAKWGERLTLEEYFKNPEQMLPSELVFGMVREPPAPRYGHQSVVTRATVLLDQHVRERELGVVCVAPVDVVLDREQELVVQPDIIFVAAARANIIRHRVWGAPDLVVEVVSPGTVLRDRTVKLGWYRMYGVRECWLVEPPSREIEVVTFASGDNIEHRRRFCGTDPVESAVLPEFRTAAVGIFD